MAFAEDLDTFFALKSAGGLADAAIYDAAGSNTPVNVLFDEPHLEELDIGATNPTVLAKASVIPATGWKDKTLTIGATVFTIQARQLVDDGAIVRLQLHRSV